MLKQKLVSCLYSGIDYFISTFKSQRGAHAFGELSNNFPPDYSVTVKIPFLLLYLVSSEQFPQLFFLT